MCRSLTLLLVLTAGTAWAAENPKPNTLTPQEITGGWIMLFDGESTFGWKAEGDVAVSDGTITVGGTKEGTLTSTTQFGPGTVRITYQLHGNQPALVTWHGRAKFVTGRPDPSDLVE